MSRYAEKTTVSSGRSRAEIEDSLMRYGATGFLFGQSQDKAIIAFESRGRRIKFVLPLPDYADFAKRIDKRSSYGRTITRTPEQQREAYEQSVRQRWRALALCIKAKLEAVESGIETFEEAFMAHIVLPNGQTLAEHAMPLIERAYQTGQMPPLLGFDG